MSALLTDNLPLLAGAPNGIKKLRELILELAVRGKLVPQDPSDEPASQLLKRIAGEKARLVAEGKIRKQKPLAEIGEEEKPFELPHAWTWVRLDEVVEVLDSLRKPVTKQDREPGPYPYYGASGIVDYVSNYIFDEPLVLIGEDGAKWGAGEKTAFSISGKTWVNNHAHVVRPIRSALLDEYLVISLVARDLGPFITGTTVPKLNQAKLVSIGVPLPPLAEQHRIVAKVDELMALCDRLEARQADTESAHARLVQALLDSLAQASDAADFAASWQRLSAHFHSLFTSESSIDALKQTLLQLAVMGKLVPQDPGDEPAGELLKRITEEKARLVAEGKLKKRKPLMETAEVKKPFELPESWGWARLEEIASVFSGNAFKSEDFQETPGIKVIKITNAGVGELIRTDDYLPDGYECEYSEFRVYEGDLILALTRPYVYGGLKVSRCPAEYDGALLNQRVASIRIDRQFSNDFAFLFFKGPIVLGIYQERFGNSGLQPNLKMSDVTTLLVPIPPIEEQHRIVAKVDQLMTLCDQLKARLTTARQLHERLAGTLIENAIA